MGHFSARDSIKGTLRESSFTEEPNVNQSMAMVSVLLQFHAFMYLGNMAKFRSKQVACYTYSKACYKSCITTKCHALWSKLNNKNNHIFMSCRCSSYCHSRIWQTALMFNITVNMQLVTYFTKVWMFVKTS